MLTAREIERDGELYNPQINWLLNIAQSELGEKGTLGGTIAALEHGGQPSGVPNTDPYSNYQMGWCCGDSPAEKWRRASAVWFRIGQAAQAVLLAHYMPRNDLPETQRAAVSGALGKLANAALWVLESDALVKLIDACMDKGRGGRKATIAAAEKRADTAVREAHRLWAAVAEMRPDGSPTDHSRIDEQTMAERATDQVKWEADFALNLRTRKLAADRIEAEEERLRGLAQKAAARLAAQEAMRWARPFVQIARAARRAIADSRARCADAP